jgi:CheY-like chemotaxis protein
MSEERAFLHDISTPLSTALFQLDAAGALVSEGRGGPEHLAKCIDRALQATRKVCDMVTARRSALRAQDGALDQPESLATVLVVDDDQDLRESIVFDLKRRGFRVLTAASGNAAFEVVRSRAVDLVVSDVKMPDGDGVELLRRIKEAHHAIPVVIFMTGFADLSLEEAYDLGANAILPKPFGRKQFFDAVDRALRPAATRWSTRPERVGADLQIQISLPDMDQCQKGHLLNIGQGGMFVALAKDPPPPHALLGFHLSLGDAGAPLQGMGTVRWRRAQADPGGYPAGCGIEFDFLDEASRKTIAAFVAAQKTKAFIPIG